MILWHLLAENSVSPSQVMNDCLLLEQLIVPRSVILIGL